MTAPAGRPPAVTAPAGRAPAVIAPAPRAVWIAVGLVALSVLPALTAPALWRLWALGLVTLVVALVVDAALALRPGALTLTFRGPPLIYVGERGALTLTLHGPAARRTTIAAVCDLGPFFVPQPPSTLTLRGGHAQATFDLWPQKRGTLALGLVALRWAGPLGLMVRTQELPSACTVPVVPNTRLVRNAALRLRARETTFGNKVERYPGEGSEFDALREHAPGMDLRALHWKASAKHRTLLAREFRAERNHQVVLCFDSGRLMVEPIAGLSRLDHAIHAGLLLTYFSLRGGDRLGLFSYDLQPRTFANPEGGPGAFARILRASAEVEGRLTETNHTRALVELARRLRRRTLIVVFTEFVDSVTATLLVEGLTRLATRHLVLFVTLGDQEIEGAREAAPHSIDGLYRAVVAGELLKERHTVLQRLRRAGVLCVDARPKDLSGQLLNRYLDIRQRELL